jgi:hypothetical protein
MSVCSTKDLLGLFASRNVDVVYFKFLADKQDNDKNQIYLGSSIEGAANLFPSKINRRTPSLSKKKRHSNSGKPKIEAQLNFFWITDKNKHSHAPNTKIIDYFQYPEIRMSGFLSNCKDAPISLRRRHQADYGKRVLCMGSNRLGETFGYVLNSKEHNFLPQLQQLPQHDSIKVFRYQITKIQEKFLSKSPREKLLNELKSIVHAGWHPSIKLNNQGVCMPYEANNGGGYTLEALLDIKPNAEKAPDKYGFEIKSHKGDKISLMTPTADGGDEGKLSFVEFMKLHGWESKEVKGKFVFTGPFRESVPKNNMVLFLHGLTNEKQWLSEEDIYVHIRKNSYSNDVSLWSLSKLLSSWEQKHAQAIYVERERNKFNQYKFKPKVYLCTGTSIWNLLFAIKDKVVDYDPAHTIYPNGEKKVRPQWRISAAKSKIFHNLKSLYNKVEIIEL